MAIVWPPAQIVALFALVSVPASVPTFASATRPALKSDAESRRTTTLPATVNVPASSGVACAVATAKPEPSSIVSDLTLPTPPMNAPDLALADAFVSAPSTSIVPACDEAVPEYALAAAVRRSVPAPIFRRMPEPETGPLTVSVWPSSTRNEPPLVLSVFAASLPLFSTTMRVAAGIANEASCARNTALLLNTIAEAEPTLAALVNVPWIAKCHSCHSPVKPELSPRKLNTPG